jgi:PilZ domain
VCTATERQNEPPEDRRQSPRIRLRDAQIIVSWDEGSEHVTCDGEVLDISGGGARVLVERAPPAGVSVRLHFGRRLAAMEPLEARCLAISVDHSGRHLVRVQFTDQDTHLRRSVLPEGSTDRGPRHPPSSQRAAGRVN